MYVVNRDVRIVVGVYVEGCLCNWNRRNLTNRDVFFSLFLSPSFWDNDSY